MLDGLDKVGIQEEEAPPGSHQAGEDGRPSRAWRPPAGKARARQGVSSAVGLRLDTLGTLSILSGSSGSKEIGAEDQKREAPELGAAVTGLGDHDRIFEEKEGIEAPGGEISEGAVRSVCELAARSICEILGAELRGGLQAALREEVSQAVRDELRSYCLQEKSLAESGCQADETTCPAQPWPGHIKTDGNLPWPTRASFPQTKTSSAKCPNGLPVLPDLWAPAAAAVSGDQRPSFDADQASCGRKLAVPRRGAEAHHRTGCGNGATSCASGRSRPAAQCLGRGWSCSGQSMGEEEQSVRVVRPSSHLSEARELFAQCGLVKYVADMASPRRSSPEGNSRPMSGCSGAHPSEGGEDSGKLEKSERTLADDFFFERDELLPRDGAKSEGCSVSSREKVHTRPQDAAPPCRRAARNASCSASMEDCGQDEQDSSSASEDAVEAARTGSSFGGQSASQHGWSRLDAGLEKVPTVEMLRKQMDKELVSQLSLDHDDAASESVASAPIRAESGRSSWLAVFASTVSSLLGSMIAPACGITPWNPAWPVVSTIYQWTVLGLLGNALYHSGKMTYREWEQGESSAAVGLAMDTIMGTGALVGIISCGAICRSRVLVANCKMLMAYAGKLGMLAHWEEVSTTDFFCTVSFWLASVLATVGEALYLEHSITAGDRLAHTGCFALFSFILIGMSQFSLHLCRCLTKMIDTFCYLTSQKPDFPNALKEWSLLQALCRTSCTSIQFAFMSLQATAAAMVLLGIQQVGRHDAAHLVALAPGLIVAMGVFRTSLWAAAVTDKCARVPMLVNSVLVDNLLDQDRMYAVHYIAYSQSGFYIFDLRLTSAAVLKTAYIACAVTFFLATRVFTE